MIKDRSLTLLWILFDLYVMITSKFFYLKRHLDIEIHLLASLRRPPRDNRNAAVRGDGPPNSISSTKWGLNWDVY